jgi:hypothetical protein
MKKIALIGLLTFGIAAGAFAGGWDHCGWGFPGSERPGGEKVSVTGNLGIVGGALAVKSGDITYLVPGLLRYAGFIESLKDGAQVKIEGSAFARPDDAGLKYLLAEKLTLGGKDYDLSRPALTRNAPAWPMMPRQPMRQRRGRW